MACSDTKTASESATPATTPPPPATEEKAPARADNLPPRPLLDFMMTGWKQPARKPAASVQGLEEFAARRKQLSQQFPGELIVVPTGHEKVRANDTVYHFRPGSDFYYLTGNTEPDCVLVLAPRDSGHEELLFCEPEVDRSTHAFFTDRARGALWVGPRLGLEGTRVRYGVDRTLPLTELGDFYKSLAQNGAAYRLLRGMSAAADAALPARADKETELAQALARMRLIKSDFEIAQLRRAIKATRHAYEAALVAMKTAKTERDVEAAFDAQARIVGAGVGYGTIVAAGAHATVLHWTRNDGKVKKGDLLLVDAGVELNEVYTADITRTFPASGKYTREQRALYDLVTDAQTAAIKATKAGVDFMAPHRAATEVLVRGLEKLGILKEPAEEALREDRQTYKRYTLHNVSHMLGLDVHDNAPLPYRQGKLEAGMVITVEPGLYFQPDDMTVPARFRGIGIRVEEDVLVTRTGARVLSTEIPRLSREVEAWIAQLWKRK